MKVRNLVKFLIDFDMDAEFIVSTGPTFNDYEEPKISWSGSDMGDGFDKKEAKFIYIDNISNTPEI